MHLANEAGYLYVLSKELITLNKKLKELSLKAEVHLSQHSGARTDEERHTHKTKHAKTTLKIAHLMRKHNELLEKLNHHHRAFDSALRREHNIWS